MAGLPTCCNQEFTCRCPRCEAEAVGGGGGDLGYAELLVRTCGGDCSAIHRIELRVLVFLLPLPQMY